MTEEIEQIYDSSLKILGCSDALKYILEIIDIQRGLSDIMILISDRIDSELKVILDLCDDLL